MEFLEKSHSSCYEPKLLLRIVVGHQILYIIKVYILKILFPFIGNSIGGSHISTLELYFSLLDENISAIIVLHEDDSLLSEYLKNKNIPFSVLKTPRMAGETPGKLSILIGILTNFFYFGNFIKTNNIDIVHGNDLRVNLSWFLPARVFSKGFVWHQRTILSTSKFWLLIAYLCDYFIAISNVVMQSSPKNIPSVKKKIVYNPFNVSSFLNKKMERDRILDKYNIPHNCFLLGCVGRVVGYKNIDFLIKCTHDIYQKLNKKVYLVVVGTGTESYLNELKKYANDLGVDKRIIFTGFLNNPNKAIAAFDLLIAPSRVDAFGRSIVEAMLQKTPVLADKFGGHVDIISEGYNGAFYDSTIKDDFIDKISIIMDGENIDTTVNNAFSFSNKEFSSKQHFHNIFNIYSGLLKS